MAGKFWDVVLFIQGFNELIDIGEFQKNYKVISKNDFIVEFNNYSSKEQIEMLLAFVGENELSYKDLEQLLYNSKKNSLKTFELYYRNKKTPLLMSL